MRVTQEDALNLGTYEGDACLVGIRNLVIVAGAAIQNLPRLTAFTLLLTGHGGDSLPTVRRTQRYSLEREVQRRTRLRTRLPCARRLQPRPRGCRWRRRRQVLQVSAH